MFDLNLNLTFLTLTPFSIPILSFYISTIHTQILIFISFFSSSHPIFFLALQSTTSHLCTHIQIHIFPSLSTLFLIDQRNESDMRAANGDARPLNNPLDTINAAATAIASADNRLSQPSVQVYFSTHLIPFLRLNLIFPHPTYKKKVFFFVS